MQGRGLFVGRPRLDLIVVGGHAGAGRAVVKTFYHLLGVALLVVTTNNFVWFALTFWAFLTTKSVISTSVMAGIFLVLTAISGFWFGSLVDHHKKKHAMLGSSVATLILFLVGLAIFHTTPASALESVSSVRLWVFVVILLSGTLAGAIYNIAIPTLVALIVPEDRRDRANGMFGTTIGIAFAPDLGRERHLSGLRRNGVRAPRRRGRHRACDRPARAGPDPAKERSCHDPRADAKGRRRRQTDRHSRNDPGRQRRARTLRAHLLHHLQQLPGRSVLRPDGRVRLVARLREVWGTLWGVLSLSFILGGLYISKKGLGANPLRILFRNNIITWTVCIFFTIQPSITLLAVGTFVWMFFVPFTEAIEQTILQKVVPPERLGRVFGFAHSIEQAASPVTAFLIGPIAHFFIPFMTTGAGVQLIGGWFGTGIGRGIALVFMTAGAVGLAVTLVAMRSKAYPLLAERYRGAQPVA